MQRIGQATISTTRRRKSKNKIRRGTNKVVTIAAVTRVIETIIVTKFRRVQRDKMEGEEMAKEREARVRREENNSTEGKRQRAIARAAKLTKEERATENGGPAMKADTATNGAAPTGHRRR
jgi:hypothetical protein